MSLNKTKQEFMFLYQARDLRNTLTHSDSLTVSEANLQENLNLLISLLSCFNDRCLTTPEALKQIKMVTAIFSLSVKDRNRRQSYLAML